MLEKLCNPGMPVQGFEPMTLATKLGVYSSAAIPVFGVLQLDAAGRIVQRGTAIIKVTSRGRRRQSRWSELMKPVYHRHEKEQLARLLLQTDDFPLMVRTAQAATLRTAVACRRCCQWPGAQYRITATRM